MELSPEKKIAGLLVPLFALRRDDDLGIGDTAALRDFLDWARESGFKLVQILPINETGGDNSPYNAISAMAIEPTTLHLAPGSPVDLSREDFEAVTSPAHLERLRRGPVKHARVKKLKRALLEKAFASFSTEASPERRAQFEAFRESERSWLEDYSLFRVLMEENKGSEAWDHWKPEQRAIESARVWLGGLRADRAARLENRRVFFAYVQWIACEQWCEVKAYAEERGVALMGDVPFGVSYYSADVFTQPAEFALDWAGGAPPEPYFKDDAFTQKWGQNWGIPVYRWEIMRANHFAWWRRRVGGVKRIFHVFRLDHVLGFYRIYTFPWRPQENGMFLELDWPQMLERTGGRAPHFTPRDDTSAENGEANRREGEEYLRSILQECGATRMVGEDLGTVPDYVRPSLHSLGIAGFKIPQWEVRHGRLTPGREFERLSVATYATHDHKPVRALWEESFERDTSTSDQARQDLWRIGEFAEFPGLSPQTDFEKEFYPAIMGALFQSNAWIAVVMITDLLGQSERFNVPGTAAETNWTGRMRMSVDRLRSSRGVRDRVRLMKRLLAATDRG